MLAMALAPAAASAHHEQQVTAGPLTATISTDPWRVRFEGALEELPETGTALPGTLGYSSGGTWFHATHVLSEQLEGGVFTAEVATTNPLGTIQVRIEPDADGVIALKATAPATASQVQISFAAREGERYLGFGERANAVDQRGNAVENYVSDGPYLEPERAPVATFVPPPGYHPRDDATYFPIPWLLSTAGYGVLLGNDERSEFDLTGQAEWSASADSAELRLRVFAGPTPAEVLERYTAGVGRQPPAAAPWYFGPWFQPKGSDADNLALFRSGDVPVSVVQTYTHYLPCADQTGRTDAERERVADALRLHAAAGRLDASELEERVGAALTARTRGDLAVLTDDLPDPAPAPAPPPQPARRHRHGLCHHRKDARSLLPIAVLLIAIWAVTGMGYFWPVWPILGIAISVLPGLMGNTRVIRSHGFHR
jgi:hypothetical protein